MYKCTLIIIAHKDKHDSAILRAQTKVWYRAVSNLAFRDRDVAGGAPSRVGCAPLRVRVPPP